MAILRQGHDLQLAVTLPEGVYVLGVALKDMATGATSVVSTTVAIHDPDREQVES